MPYNNPNPPSRYLPIWQALKKDKIVKLAVNPRLARRIVKAVKKRRDLDLAYKFELAEQQRREWIMWDIKASILTIRIRSWLLNPEDI